MTEQFVDLSHHNEVADLAAYARAGHTRVALKATEGTTFTDPAFTGRWAEAGRAGLRRGAYHFAKVNLPAATQVDALLAAVASAGGLAAGDWLVLDLEDDAGVAQAAHFAGEFCGRMVVRGHHDGLIYTRTGYAAPAGLTPGDVPAGWRRLWLADYNAGHQDAGIPLPAWWSRSQVVARQFTDRAAVPGIGGPVDYSRVLADWITEDDMALSDEDVQRLRLAWRADMQEMMVKALRSEGVSGAATEDPAPLAAALAPLILADLPAGTAPTEAQVTAAVVAGLRKVAATVATEPTP